MKRRNFLKMSGSAAAAGALPIGFSMPFFANKAHAGSPAYNTVTAVAPTVMPQVINIFMYGGASELAGNLTNMADINTNSVNDYSANNAFGGRILRTQAEAVADPGVNDDDWEITVNGCWRSAGGEHMEEMLAAGDMSIYRTILKQASPTRSHRESIFMSHKGTLDIENSAGIGSRLALSIMQNESTYTGASLADGTTIQNINEMILPFVSFEGDTQTYALDPENTIPLNFRGLTMDNNFNNPYSRGSQTNSEQMIEDLVAARNAEIGNGDGAFEKASNAFTKRQELETRMQELQNLSDTNQTPLPAGVTYPNTRFADQIRAAVTLALHNPETLYISVGTPGLGGWDDHNNGVDRYPGRMNDLMDAVKAGVAHIKGAAGNIQTLSGNTRNQTDNIIINVFGDFGRLVNLNNSMGWDHANNQNLYTFGGAGVRPPKEAAALGSVVGTTERQGTPKTNNQYTMPTSDSPKFEPMSIAASVYSYFGIQNPEVLTADPEMAPSGHSPLENGLP